MGNLVLIWEGEQLAYSGGKNNQEIVTGGRKRAKTSKRKRRKNSKKSKRRYRRTKRKGG